MNIDNYQVTIRCDAGAYNISEKLLGSTFDAYAKQVELEAKALNRGHQVDEAYYERVVAPGEGRTIIQHMTKKQIAEMDERQAKMRFILEPMARYVENSGFTVGYDTTTGDAVVLIQSEDECIRLEHDDRDAFIRQVNEYEREMGGDCYYEVAELAAAKPYVESLA